MRVMNFICAHTLICHSITVDRKPPFCTVVSTVYKKATLGLCWYLEEGLANYVVAENMAD